MERARPAPEEQPPEDAPRPDEPRPDEPRPGEGAAAPADGARCPYCHVTIPWGETAAACDACTAPHHAQCFGEHRGCAASGCQGQTARAIMLRPRVDPRPKCAVCAGVLEPESWVAQCGCGWRAHVACDASLRCPLEACGRPTRLGTLGFLRASGRVSQLRSALGLLVVFAVLGLSAAAAGGVGLAAVDSLNLTGRQQNDLFAALFGVLLIGGAGGVFSLFAAFFVRGQLARAEDEQRAHATRRPRPPSAKEPDPRDRPPPIAG